MSAPNNRQRIGKLKMIVSKETWGKKIIRGTHSIKTGFSFRRIQLNAASNQFQQGVYFYQGLPPNPFFPQGLSSLDAFLFGLPAIFIAPQPGADFYRGIRQSIVGTYVQDDWQ